MSFLSFLPMASGLLGKAGGGSSGKGSTSSNNQALLNWAQNAGRTKVNAQYAQLGIPNSTARAMDLAGVDASTAALGAGLNQQNFQNMLQLAQLANQGAGQGGAYGQGFNTSSGGGDGQSTTPGGGVGATSGTVS